LRDLDVDTVRASDGLPISAGEHFGLDGPPRAANAVARSGFSPFQVIEFVGLFYGLRDRSAMLVRCHAETARSGEFAASASLAAAIAAIHLMPRLPSKPPTAHRTDQDGIAPNGMLVLIFSFDACRRTMHL
jgi:hypothetical protein